MDGLERIAAGLARLPAPEAPAFFDPATLAEAIQVRYAARGFGGPVRHALGVALRARVPCRAAHLADLLTDPEVQRETLGARSVERLGEVRRWAPDRTETSYRVVKTDVGAGPIRVTLVFSVTVERWDVPDGSIWIRYDPRPAGEVRNVTYWRGLARIDPQGDGALFSEILVMGTDLTVPPLLGGALRTLARDTLKDARRNLLLRAAAR